MTEFRTPSGIKPVSRLPDPAQALRGLAAPGLLMSVLAGRPVERSIRAGPDCPYRRLPRRRLSRALFLLEGGDAVLAWRRGAAGRVLISGGSPGAPLAGQMRNFLVHSGVPAERIETDLNSQSTRESALQCAARLRGITATKVLLTSDYHMHRAVRCFRAAGLDVAPRPIPDARKQYMRIEERWSVFLSLVKETAKIVYYRLRGWM